MTCLVQSYQWLIILLLLLIPALIVGIVFLIKLINRIK